MTNVEIPREARPSMLRHIDYFLPFITLLISGVGVLMVYSATRGPATTLRPAQTQYLERQFIFVVIGIVAMVATAWIGHRIFQKFALHAYTLMTLSLVLVLFIGVESKGTKAWYQVGGYQLQPSEFGKIILIVALAAWYGSTNTGSGRKLFFALIVTGIPGLLIWQQPDLGTLLVYGAIIAGMTLVGGVKGRHMFIFTLIVVTFAVVILQSDSLQNYQIDRLLVFIDEEADSGARYNLEQAQVAIGNGGITGKGLFEGTQNNSDLVPEQQNDFIFTVIAEETGFIGSMVVLGLLALLLIRIWRISQIADDKFGSLLAAGVFSMLLFQIFQSVGMAVGIMPITGIPLPLISHGGSSVISTFIGIGLVQSVHMRRHDYRYDGSF